MSEAAAVSHEQIQQTVADAFVYAYPMVFNYKTLFNQVLNTDFPGYVGGSGNPATMTGSIPPPTPTL